MPDIINAETVENDIDAKCCLCRTKWTTYRGQFKCSQSLCHVPVIVCQNCTREATDKPENLICELCRQNHRMPSEMPDLVGLKRKADEIADVDNSSPPVVTSNKKDKLAQKPKSYYKDRLFFRKVPLTASFTKLKDTLGPKRIKALHWLTDRESGGFYGSCIALMSSVDDKIYALERASTSEGIRLGKKKIKIMEVFKKESDDNLFQKDFAQRE